MKNLVIVNLNRVNPFGLQKCGTLTALEGALERIQEFPDVSKWVFVASDPEAGAFPRPPSSSFFEMQNLHELFEVMIRESEGFDHVFYTYGDQPFLSPALTRKMLSNHLQYRAEYSFAEGYPSGLAVEILKPSILKSLQTLSQDVKAPWDGSEIFAVISKDINAFDIETEIPETDLRSLRIQLNTGTKGQWKMLQTLWPLRDLEVEPLLKKLKENQTGLRSLPAYFQVQVTPRVLQRPNHSPLALAPSHFPATGEDMPRERWEPLLSSLAQWAGGGVFNPSLWGEPSCHGQIYDILAYASELGLSTLVESSGLGWDVSQIEKLCSVAQPGKKTLDWIVELDALSPDLYRQIRGDGFHEAQEFIRRIHQLSPGHVWPQMTRIPDNQNEALDFYQHWKKEVGQAIIQKYNSFSRRLPPWKLTDLSPIKREACWHLKRDLVILLDGSVVLCREDYESKVILGNVFQDSLDFLWEKGHQLYLEHLNGNYLPLCKDCDEYYTYHF